MFLLLLGIALAVAINSFAKYNFIINKYKSILITLAIAIAAVGIIRAVFVQVGPGRVGVQTLFGKVQDRYLTSGLNIINPLVKVEIFDIKTQNYTMSGIHDEGEKMGDDAIRVLTHDGLEVVIDLTVLFSIRPDQAPNIYRQIGSDYKNVVVRPITRTKIRDNAVYYDAVDLYSAKRDEFQNRIFKDIEANFKARGLVLEQILVRNITLPATVKASIESKINAEQEAQKMQFVLQKERQEADRKRVEAQGISDAQKTISMSLTEQLLKYELIKAQKEIALSPNSKVIIMNGKDTPVILGDK